MLEYEKIKKKYIRKIIKNMKQLGVHKPEFENMISVYADILFQYDYFLERFVQGGCQITEEHTNKAGATNEKKTSLYTALESLRKDIASYSDKLGLNPKAFDKLDITEEKESTLEQALKKLGK